MRLLAVALTMASMAGGVSSASAMDFKLVNIFVYKELAGKCGLVINPTTQGWINNFAKLEPEKSKEAADYARTVAVNTVAKLGLVETCTRARSHLLSEGWL